MDNIFEILSKFFVFLNNNPKQAKIVIGSKENVNHYTIHFGENSEYFNIHKTDEKSGNNNKIFVIKKTDAMKVIADLKLHIPSLFFNYLFSDKINITVLIRNNWIVLPIGEHPEELKSFVKIKGKRLRFSDNVDTQKMFDLFKLAKELPRHNDKAFMVFNKKNELIGTLVKDFADSSSREFYFIKESNFVNFQRHIIYLVGYLIDKNDIENKQYIQSIYRDFLKEQEIFYEHLK